MYIKNLKIMFAKYNGKITLLGKNVTFWLFFLKQSGHSVTMAGKSALIWKKNSFLGKLILVADKKK